MLDEKSHSKETRLCIGFWIDACRHDRSGARSGVTGIAARPRCGCGERNCLFEVDLAAWLVGVGRAGGAETGQKKKRTNLFLNTGALLMKQPYKT